MTSKQKIISATIGICAGLLYVYYKWEGSKRYPRGYTMKKKVKKMKRKSQNKTIRNRYVKHKIPKDIDVIVIGSGTSGLSAASILAQVGKRVLVLEQHDRAGGTTHVFEDKGYEFDTGVHYIGGVSSPLLLDVISDANIKWDTIGNEQNGFCYDEYIIHSDSQLQPKHYKMRAGKQEWLNEVSKHFSKSDLKAAEKYLRAVKKSHKDLEMLCESKFIRYPWLRRIILKFYNLWHNNSLFVSFNTSALDMVRRYTNNRDLIGFLLAQSGDVGRYPNKYPFALHASVTEHYLDGATYPRNGCSTIAQGIINVIRQTGGDVLVGKSVKNIIINDKNDSVMGVCMSNGDKIFANTVISSVGLYNTYNKIIPTQNEKKYIPKAILNNINECGFSTSMIYLFVGMNGDAKELGLKSSNLWVLPDDYYENEEPNVNLMHMFIAFPCMKDSNWNNRYPNKSTAVVLTLCDYKEFEQWEKTKHAQRDEAYKRKKQSIENQLLESLFKYFPKTRGKVDYTSISSPLTFNQFLGTNKGEVYGLDANKMRFTMDQDCEWLEHKTHINGFYVASQDLMTSGVCSAAFSGVTAASHILGYGGVSDIITGRNVIGDILNAKG